VQGVTAYLVDLQHELLALVDPVARDDDDPLPALSIDATLAGRAFQTEHLQRQGWDDTDASTGSVPPRQGCSRPRTPTVTPWSGCAEAAT